MLSKPNEIKNGFYAGLLELAKKLEENQCWTGAIVCYRSLLLDILNQARSKAYTHAVRYYKKLALLSESVEQFSPLVDHVEFVKQLDGKHGRKRSFWERVL